MVIIMTADEYKQKFSSIITDWFPSPYDNEGERVLLLGGAQRIVRPDGNMSVGIVDTDGKERTDSHFVVEDVLRMLEKCSMIFFDHKGDSNDE